MISTRVFVLVLVSIASACAPAAVHPSGGSELVMTNHMGQVTRDVVRAMSAHPVAPATAVATKP